VCSSDLNAVQIGGYEPSTVIDFEIPKKYGLRQTIGDTLGIGGIFRTLRTLPVMIQFARDMETVCPDAWMLNYANPMAMLSAGIQRATNINYVGLCHSVQNCADILIDNVGMKDKVNGLLKWRIAGINHQAWLLKITDGGKDLYPEIKRHAAENMARVRAKGGAAVEKAAREKLGDDWRKDPDARLAHDMVRLEIMLRSGYYHTESSEHASEYVPWFIKSTHPELIDEYNIPLDEYPHRCRTSIDNWHKARKELTENTKLTHERTYEYASYIMEAMETNIPVCIHGSVLNTGLITNLPNKAAVEVPCLVGYNGVEPCFVGDLPEPCAAMNRTSVNVQILAVEAVLTGQKDYVYQAAMLDPHTAAELTLDEIYRLCDDLFEAHGDMLPKFS